MVVDAATGNATRITKSTGYYYYPSTSWGYSTSSNYVDVSTKGTYVAYVKYINGSTYNLYVSKTDGSGTPIDIGSTANFNGNQTSTAQRHLTCGYRRPNAAMRFLW